MKICKEFIIRDIIEYKVNNNIDLLQSVINHNFFAIIDAIKIGNKCSEEEALSIYEELSKEYDMTDIVKQLCIEIIGKEKKENEPTENTDDRDFTTILTDFYNQLKSVGDCITITEFYNMSTSMLYIYSDGVYERILNDENRKLRDQYSQAITTASMFSKKPMKEPIQYNKDGTLHKKSALEKLAALKNR